MQRLSAERRPDSLRWPPHLRPALGAPMARLPYRKSTNKRAVGVMSLRRLEWRIINRDKFSLDRTPYTEPCTEPNAKSAKSERANVRNLEHTRRDATRSRDTAPHSDCDTIFTDTARERAAQHIRHAFSRYLPNT